MITPKNAQWLHCHICQLPLPFPVLASLGMAILDVENVINLMLVCDFLLNPELSWQEEAQYWKSTNYNNIFWLHNCADTTQSVHNTNTGWGSSWPICLNTKFGSLETLSDFKQNPINIDKSKDHMLVHFCINQVSYHWGIFLRCAPRDGVSTAVS